MTLLTIEEASSFLRLKKRTMYVRKDIPRVRYGHQIMFIKEDLEDWVRARRQVDGKAEAAPEASAPVIDLPRPTVYHRNPLFDVSRVKGAR